MTRKKKKTTSTDKITENVTDLRTWIWLIPIIMTFVSLAMPIFTLTSNTSFSVQLFWFQVNTGGYSGSTVTIMAGFGWMLLIGGILIILLLIFSIIGFNFKEKLIPIMGLISGLMIFLVPLLIYLIYPGMTINSFLISILPSWSGNFTGTVLNGSTTVAVIWTYNWTFSLAHVVNYVGAVIILFNSILYLKDIRISLKK